MSGHESVCLCVASMSTISNLAGAGAGRIYELKSGCIRIWGQLVLGSLDEINGVNNADSCYSEEVQFSAFFVTSLFASF